MNDLNKNKKSLKKNEAINLAIYENSMDAILVTKPDGSILAANPAACAMFGRTEEEIIKAGRSGMVDITDKRLPALLEERARKGKVRGALRFLRKDGSSFDCEGSSAIFYDESGKASTIMIIRDLSDLKRLERDIIENEKNQRALLNAVGDSLFLIKTDGTILLSNDKLAADFGKDPDDLPGSNTFNLVSHELAEKRRSVVTEIISTGLSCTITDMRDERFIESRLFPIIEENGSVSRLAIYARDITEKKLAELSLAKTELLLHRVLSSAPLTIFATDNNGIFTLSEGRELQSAGLEPGENVGISAFDLYRSLPFTDKNNVKITGEDVLKRALSGETLVVTSELNGVCFDNHIGPILDEGGRVTGIVGIAINITEQKLTEQALKGSESRYRMLFEHSVVPIWEEDFSEVKKFFDYLKNKRIRDIRSYFRKHPEKISYCASLVKIIEVNQTSISFFGVKDKTDLLIDLPQFFTDDSLDFFREEIIALAEGKKVFESDIPIKMLDEKIRHLHLRLQVLPGHYETLSKVLVSWIDITDRLNYEDALKESSEILRELNRHIEDARENERTRIALNLHDDLGQKLTAIKMDISWLKSRIGVQSPLVEKKLDGMKRLLDSTVETVQKISSDLRPGILYDLGLKPAIEWQLGEFKRNTGIRSVLKISPSEFIIDDKLSIIIYRIIQESLTNIARHSEADNVTISLRADNEVIKLIIADNGIGIDEEKINSPKSFGLIGIKERAGAYGGEVRITGSKGKGTEVKVIIPAGGK